MLNPVKVIAEILGALPSGQVDQVPYCFTDTIVLFGSPLTRVEGLDSVRCRFLHPRAKRFSSLGGGGCFLSNRNTSGEIEFRFGQGAFSMAFVEMFNATGASMPLVVADKSTGGTGSVVGTACRIVDVGEFSREEEAPMIGVKLEADRMALFHGLRLPAINF